MPLLLVIDDEPNVLYSLENALRSSTLNVLTTTTAKQGILLARERSPDAVLLDVRLPDMCGLDAFIEIQRADSHLPVIMMTAYTATDTAIEAMKRGAFDYLIKPVDLHQLRSVVAKAIDLRKMTTAPPEFQTVDQLETPTETIVGHSSVMQDVYKAVGRVAATDVNVLILGESGTGKELVARAIHHHSRRGKEPLLAINCAAIPETLLESELFGHERGSFTGAEKRRVGKFEQAHGGTIFLDEIGDMSGPTQAKVLRVLQDQRFERVGGNETVQADARVIAATNQDLEQLAEVGRFRRDLYYRLKVFTVQLPPLRGNVRELQGAIKNALVNATDEVLTSDCLPANIRRGAALTQQLATSTEHGLNLSALTRQLLVDNELEIYHKALLALDRAVLEEVLHHVQGNQVEAARRLGISRTTLRAKLQALKLADGTGPLEPEQDDQ